MSEEAGEAEDQANNETPQEVAAENSVTEADSPAASEGTPSAGMPDEGDLIEALKQVIDPELMVNIVDLGLIYSVEQQDEGVVAVDMTLTSPSCPAGPQLVQQAKMALERLDGVNDGRINIVMSPPWTPERMTEDARDQLGIF